MLLWAIQTQLLSQIIANRVALIMVSRQKSLQLRWGLFIAIGLVNIAVGCIWTPAHLETASDFQKNLNVIFENVEKSFFLVVDLGLNLYFLYLVRYRLIADGLDKYWTLYKFNIGFVAISTTMDALLLGLLSLPNSFAYATHPSLDAITSKLEANPPANQLRPIRPCHLHRKTLPRIEDGSAHLESRQTKYEPRRRLLDFAASIHEPRASVYDVPPFDRSQGADRARQV